MLRRCSAAFAALCLGLFLCVAPLAAQDTVEVRISRAEGQLRARIALAEGQTTVAVALAEALLAADPDDPVGLTVLAAAGAGPGAEAAGRRAWHLAGTPDTRFEAAWLTAHAMLRNDRPGAAKLWLRKAGDVAPTPAHAALVARAFAGARQRAPLTLYLSFSVGPSDNVNGGSLHDTFWLWGFPFAIAERQSGGQASASLQGTWRLARAARYQTDLTFGLGHQDGWTGGNGPDADYRRTRAEVGLRHRWKMGEAPVVWHVAARSGRQWQAGRPVADDMALSFGADWTLRPDLIAAVEVTRSETWNGVDARRSSDGWKASARLRWVTDAAGTFDIGLTRNMLTSQAADVEHDGTRLSLGWAPETFPMGLEAAFSMSLEHRDYPKVAVFGTDVLVDAQARFGLPKLSRYGFIPEITLTARRVRSDFAPRDTSELGATLGLRSEF